MIVKEMKLGFDSFRDKGYNSMYLLKFQLNFPIDQLNFMHLQNYLKPPKYH
jgi:hypothetical protein